MKSESGLHIPDSLKQQLLDFRRRVWTIKFVETVSTIALVSLAAFLLVYVGDRFSDLPSIVRGALVLAAIATTLLIPWFAYRWVWQHRQLEPLARLLGKKLPAVGDQLLGVIELSQNDSEQARSPALCHAAMQQVALDAAKRDFAQSTPPSRHVPLAGIAVVLSTIAAGLAIAYPGAAKNALARLTMPWQSIPRYTFTRIADLPTELIVAHGEPADLAITLTQQSQWQPSQATITLGGQRPITAERDGDQYRFTLPPQIQPQSVIAQVGDVTHAMTIQPTLRPELTGITAKVRLPDYLKQSEVRDVDARAGTLSVVRGSQAVLTATANRDLASGAINDQVVQPAGPNLTSDSVQAQSTPQVKFQWQDRMGLTGHEPFELTINAIDDESPTLICDGIPRQTVLLDSETIKFSVQASDDFGIRRVGMMWRGFPNAVNQPAKGERLLAAGEPTTTTLDALGTFSAKSLQIAPQPIELYVWTEDFFPNRNRVYSPPHLVYVLTPEQHAIWITEQLSKWHRQALEVRDRERQLYEKNKELRSLTPQELAGSDRRREVRRQASSEQANGRRLARLGESGEQLVRTAARNPEIGVGHLERWAEMLQVLGDLSENRMPSVADLLIDAAESPTKLASSPKTKNGPAAGQIRSAKPGASSEVAKGASPKLRSAPQLADMESSANSPDENPSVPGPPKKPSSPSLRLPVTTVMGKNPKPGEKPTPPNQQDSIDSAVEEQEDLLAEFDRLADELNAVLANLEGSTLVKRLKAASRQQNLVAQRLTGQLQPTFGVSKFNIKAPNREVLEQLEESEQVSTKNVSFIMDDLSAYFQRRRFMQFKQVLDEMKQADVLGGLRTLASEISTKQGLSVSQAEYWSDSMDRWAENLVDPACSGSCPGGKSPESLPPSIVLEVLQILEAEIDLREETRVADQAVDAVDSNVHAAKARELAATQLQINQRVVDVIARIGELKDAQKHFGKELKMLAEVDLVMTEAAEILASAETGSPAIAAETHAIELILRSKRINPSGGGGGSGPGGGGNGNTTDSALALLGKGTNAKEVRQRRDVSQTTGETGTVLPEEFRRGLDRYFDRLGGT